MTLHLGLHHHRSAEQQAEIREARRMLQGRVRTDWYYPALPAHQEAQSGIRPQQQEQLEDEESKVAGFKFHVPRADEHFEPLQWRERDYASSDEDSEEDQNEIAAVRASNEKKGTSWEVLRSKQHAPDPAVLDSKSRRTCIEVPE